MSIGRAAEGVELELRDKRLMDSNKTGDRYLRLETLAQELRVYKEKQYEIPRSEGEPTSQDANLSLTKRAAVLVCIFEGDDGDLRVILTKRSSTLSLNSSTSTKLPFLYFIKN